MHLEVIYNSLCQTISLRFMSFYVLCEVGMFSLAEDVLSFRPNLNIYCFGK